MKTSTKIITIIFLLLIIAGGAYWYMFFYGPGNQVEPVVTTGTTGGFVPLNAPNDQNGSVTNNTSSGNADTNSDNAGTNASTTADTPASNPIPYLRLLSDSPIGGYGASTTASTTVVRWIDRGRGNVLEAKGDSLEIVTLSNTILPRTYESVWNRNLTAMIGSLLSTNTDVPTVVYAKLNQQATTTKITTTTSNTASSTASTTVTTSATTNITPYNLKGKNLPANMLAYAVSPKGDKVFMLIKENGQSAGYLANFDGTSVSKIFVNPLTQVNVEWPEETTIAITTKGSASHAGFLYFVNTKTGLWKKILGPIYGLSTKVSRDAKYILASGTGKDQTVTTSIYSIGTTTPTDATLRTLADKCVWGNFYREIVYCATPAQQVNATYPDDWYRGNVTSSDKIWQLNVKTGDIRLVSSIFDKSDRLINAFNLGLDTRDDFLFFMNKDDLSFWSLDLNAR
jgi:hypothetical protein